MNSEQQTRRRRRPAGATATVRLADVARLADVSEITVSRILRDVGPVAEETRQRVLAAVRDTGYVRNQVAGTLASASSNLIGVIIPSLSNIVFAEVLRGIDGGLEPSGYRPVVGITGYDPAVEEKLVGSLLAWKPAAMIIVGFDHTEATRRLLARSGVRIAELMDIDSTPVDLAVGLSHRAAGYATGRHLVARGYRRFGYVGHDWDADRRARLRWEGLVQALTEAGLALVGQTRDPGPSSTLAGRQGLARLLQEGSRPDVVVFSNDDMAVGGVFHCLAERIVPKHDLGLFGFNGLDIGQALPTPLSTIRSDRFGIGRIAVEQILARPHRDAGPQIIDTGFTVVTGETA